MHTNVPLCGPIMQNRFNQESSVYSCETEATQQEKHLAPNYRRCSQVQDRAAVFETQSSLILPLPGDSVFCPPPPPPSLIDQEKGGGVMGVVHSATLRMRQTQLCKCSTEIQAVKCECVTAVIPMFCEHSIAATPIASQDSPTWVRCRIQLLVADARGSMASSEQRRGRGRLASQW